MYVCILTCIRMCVCGRKIVLKNIQISPSMSVIYLMMHRLLRIYFVAYLYIIVKTIHDLM